MKTFTYTFRKTPLVFQIIFGVACGYMNLTINGIAGGIIKIPFYLDTIFTVAAGLISLPCGITCALSYNFCDTIIKNHSFLPSWFIICSISVAVISWLFSRNESEMTLLKIMSLAVILILVISIEGGLIYDLIYADSDYIEDTANNIFTFSLLMNRIPLLWASILSRIPINIIDKTIAAFAGYFVAKEVNRKIA